MDPNQLREALNQLDVSKALAREKAYAITNGIMIALATNKNGSNPEADEVSDYFEKLSGSLFKVILENVSKDSENGQEKQQEP